LASAALVGEALGLVEALDAEEELDEVLEWLVVDAAAGEVVGAVEEGAGRRADEEDELVEARVLVPPDAEEAPEALEGAAWLPLALAGRPVPPT